MPDLAILITTATEFEAQTKAVVLRAQGIEATVTPNTPSWSGSVPLTPAGSGNATVWVRQEDLARAQKALQQTVEDSVDLDWDEVDVGERVDDLPLRRINRMPLLVRMGFALAVAIIIISVVTSILVLL